MPNTYTRLEYHIVFSTKHRARTLTHHLDDVHRHLGGCFRDLGATPLRLGGVEDHVHAFIRIKPTHRLADLLRDVMRGSSEWPRRTIRDFHRQDGYSAFTVSASDHERVGRYVATQGEHHARTSFEDELRTLLAEHGMVYDERYLL